MALEMVLNELSLQPADDVYIARQRMDGFIQTVRAATYHRVSRVIRTQSDISDVVLAEGYPMRLWLNDQEVDFEARRYVRSIATKVPPWDGLDDLYDEVLASEFSHNGRVACGLGVAYLLEALAISLASETCWDVTRLSVNAHHLMDDGHIEEETVSVVHASQPEHVNEHGVWIQERLRSDIQDGNDLWNRKEDLLPYLVFCQDAGRQIQALSPTMLRPVVNRLFELDSYCREWTEERFDPSQLPFKTTSESQVTLDQFGRERAFRCPDGIERTFKWHGRVTPGNWRIYFHPNLQARTMIVGYIGRKLPSVKYLR